MCKAVKNSQRGQGTFIAAGQPAPAIGPRTSARIEGPSKAVVGWAYALTRAMRPLHKLDLSHDRLSWPLPEMMTNDSMSLTQLYLHREASCNPVRELQHLYWARRYFSLQ